MGLGVGLPGDRTAGATKVVAFAIVESRGSGWLEAIPLAVELLALFPKSGSGPVDRVAGATRVVTFTIVE